MTSSTDDRRAVRSAPRGTSNGTRASRRVRLARTMRCATVGSGTRNARAISSVVSPPSNRRVSATRASVESTGWQAMNMSQVLRHTYVAHQPRERGDQLRRLDPPDGVDRLMGLGCRHRLRSFCATRALTSFRTSAAGRGLSTVKRMVPLDVSYDASSFLNAFRAVPGKKLQ